MTKHRDEKEPAFKVVDRRRFTEDGEETNPHETEEPKKAPTLNDETNASSSKAKTSVRPPMTFSFFVQSLVHQAMMALGMVPWPDSGLVKLELQLAKETIDILVMLKEKTAGNLSNEEQPVLDTLLYQLQIAYVDIAKTAPENGPVLK